MLHLFLLSNLLLLTIAHPYEYYKYPYVYLLDVGNEEIGRSDIEQIRLTIPGGSMAVKYPAVDDGDVIAHVRVTGIDFGTDLKVNIVEGGPGYKFIVIVFSGNPGKSYDAVVSIQTVPVASGGKGGDDDYNSPFNSVNDDNDNEEDNKNDNNIEDDIDTGSLSMDSSDDSEVIQSSSNIYKYAVNEMVNSEKFDVSSDDHENEGEVGNEPSNINNDNDGQDNSYVKESSKIDSSVVINNKVSDKYAAFKPHFYGGVRFYPQAAVYTQSAYDQSDDTDIPLNEDDDAQSNKYKDANNHADVDYASPVDY